eukprot:scaffold8060_cov110-Cylindrotheca_fusiformis.AAC.3
MDENSIPLEEVLVGERTDDDHVIRTIFDCRIWIVHWHFFCFSFLLQEAASVLFVSSKKMLLSCSSSGCCRLHSGCGRRLMGAQQIILVVAGRMIPFSVYIATCNRIFHRDADNPYHETSNIAILITRSTTRRNRCQPQQQQQWLFPSFSSSFNIFWNVLCSTAGSNSRNIMGMLLLLLSLLLGLGILHPLRLFAMSSLYGLL